MKTSLLIALAVLPPLQGVGTAEAQLYPIVVQQQSQRSADREYEREEERTRMKRAYEKELSDQKQSAKRELCHAKREILCDYP